MKRKLDGIFFRIGTENICFSDLTDEQRIDVMKDRSEEWLKSLCMSLAHTIKEIGEQFNLVRDEGE